MRPLKIIAEHLDKIEQLPAERLIVSILFARMSTHIDCCVLQITREGYSKIQSTLLINARHEYTQIMQEGMMMVAKSKLEIKRQSYLIESGLLRGLVADKLMVQVGPQEINQHLHDCVNIYLQVPASISELSGANVQHLGYTYNPSGKLSTTGNSTISRANLNDIIEMCIKCNTHPHPQFKEYQRLNSLLSVCTFEIELALRVSMLENNHIYWEIGGGKQAVGKFQEIYIKTTQKPETVKEAVMKMAEDLVEIVNRSAPSQQIDQLCFFPNKIANPHQYIKTARKEKHLLYFTKGVYEYYHYGDQSFNDQGWGCAYRSLQTLLSWLTLQNHLHLKKMLTIHQIQEVLDTIDLNLKLKNTCEWIGAIEVSWVVKNLTGLDSKILHISNGKDVMQHCEAFRQHFERVGSPIMYGGGEYAYSIVGINYCWKLGECEFLILDPHYNGSDRIDKIIEKKGVSWRKAPEMFKAGVFYNFCLPMLPL